MAQFKPGETAYVLVHNNRVEEVTIIQKRGDRYSMKTKDSIGMFLPASRIFKTRGEAELSTKRTPVANARLEPPNRHNSDYQCKHDVFWDAWYN